MEMYARVRWLYASLGLWLLVSSFLLLGGQSPLMNAPISKTSVLMLGGLTALLLACLNKPWHDQLQMVAGVTLGLSMIAAPLALDFAKNSVAVWNA